MLGGDVNPTQTCQGSRQIHKATRTDRPIQVRNYRLTSHTSLAANTTTWTDKKWAFAATLARQKPAMYTTSDRVRRPTQADGVAIINLKKKKKSRPGQTNILCPSLKL